ncbi:MAG TPA: TRIC cation channel family protein, partial [Anaerolineae bacterium]
MNLAPAPAILAAGVVWFHGWKWTGNFITLDLIAAGTNALNGALLARRPDHYKNFTVVGIILMALLMGLGGGMTRDILVNKIPGALLNPAYVTVCLVAGIIGY